MAEWQCMGVCLRFARRHRRYLGIFLVLYGRSLLRWRQMRAARFGYGYLQLFDDLMDGDLPCTESPDALAARTMEEWDAGIFAGDATLSRLGAIFHAELAHSPEGRTDVHALLQAMHFDSQRRLQQLLLDEHTLRAHLHRTFHHSVNILLIVSGMRTRAKEAPGLVKALAWCSVVRDFKEDVAAGIINIPQGVVEEVRGRGDEVRMTAPEVARWLEGEREKARAYLAESRVALEEMAVREPRAARLLGVFQRSVEKYAE